MSKKNTLFRYDYVGSFLRPAELKQARADFADGKIGTAELKAAEDIAIRDLADKQKKSGVPRHHRRRVPPCHVAFGFHVGLPRRRA